MRALRDRLAQALAAADAGDEVRALELLRELVAERVPARDDGRLAAAVESVRFGLGALQEVDDAELATYSLAEAVETLEALVREQGGSHGA